MQIGNNIYNYYKDEKGNSRLIITDATTGEKVKPKNTIAGKSGTIDLDANANVVGNVYKGDRPYRDLPIPQPNSASTIKTSENYNKQQPNWYEANITKSVSDYLNDLETVEASVMDTWVDERKNVKPIYKRQNPDAIDLSDILEAKEVTYRCILTPNKLSYHYVRINGKRDDLSDEELLNVAFSGDDRDIRLIDKLPDTQVNPSKKVKSQNKIHKPKVAHTYITIEEFNAKTNHLFDLPMSSSTYFDYYNARISRGTFIERIRESTCPKNITVISLVDSSIGITTGRVFNGNEIEIIFINITGGRYTNKSTYKIDRMHYHMIDVTDPRRHLSLFFRFKLKGYETAIDVLKDKTYKKKSVGRIYNGFEVGNISSFFDKDEKLTYSIIIRDTKMLRNYTFAISDFEMIMINSKYLQSGSTKINKQIEKNKQAVVVDDRRLDSLKRGDIVKVLSIVKNESNIKKSLVSILDKTNQKQTVLLKQLKPYGNDFKKETNPVGKKSTNELPY